MCETGQNKGCAVPGHTAANSVKHSSWKHGEGVYPHNIALVQQLLVAQAVQVLLRHHGEVNTQQRIPYPQSVVSVITK